ncbi:MAG: hypothetical protein A3C90_03365 [Candidatus Magasanikbacteria bacterium RIFCSPHIGHO2_02_FULL_51_14]|uniref:YprB ribonuclease H-like domain-containing protein n=1 Tax=Candidatus Magasanikbacteria bacterium RIFCSPHIGHO2_02_FULL_51_14 TaxID=1798683 RepID=A0A1F6MFN0_9BACT|nr:MAG: hypothetical protein A3C90_03365 [Candidatus Magasanikbacteria bacterium RIFCSPHIGHO2_02_FULL_51_14]
MPEIVFDIETIGDIRDLNTQKVTVVSVYEYATDTYRSFEDRELGELWPLFEKAERLIGYNSEHFDVPILNKYYAGDLSKFPHLDLMKVIKQSSGSRFKLNDIAKATLQIEKIGNGLEAQKWFESGDIQKVKEYCEQDVKLTKELYEFGRKNKMLYYPKLTGEIMPIAVNFDSQPVGGAQGAGGGSINLTLPL